MTTSSGRNIPDSISSIRRNVGTLRIKLASIKNTSIPNTFNFVDATISTGQNVQTRRMLLKSNPAVFYEFTFPPVQISYDGFGVDLTEIPRPLQRPLIDIRGSKNYKAVFEFLVASQFDGMYGSVENQIRTLEWFANTGEPVFFENFDFLLSRDYWYIAEFSVKTSRVNTSGEIVAAQCSISLLEYQETTTKFAKFPKLNYTPTTTRKKTTGGGGGSGDLNPGTGSTPAGAGAGQQPSVIDTTVNPVVYRWSRTDNPAALKPNDTFEPFKDLWTKETVTKNGVKSTEWVIYTSRAKFPFATAFYDFAHVTPTIVDYKGNVKKTYDAQRKQRAELQKPYYPIVESDPETAP